MKEVAFDQMCSLELVTLFNQEDQKVALCIRKILPQIATAVDLIAQRMLYGGRLFYMGSGSGGKIAVLDASECPPTFGTDDHTVIALLSGGSAAAAGWLEETEDNEDLAFKDLQIQNFSQKDTLVAVTASGTTPYALAGLSYAKKLGAKTIAVCCCSNSTAAELADVALVADVGQEIIVGSTRLKAGTAQKMILNMLSSCTMIKLGKTYGPLMIGVRPINKKLKKRLMDIIITITGVDLQRAQSALQESGGDAKAAVLMLRRNLSVTEAKLALKRHHGFLSKALEKD